MKTTTTGTIWLECSKCKHTFDWDTVRGKEIVIMCPSCYEVDCAEILAFLHDGLVYISHKRRPTREATILKKYSEASDEELFPD